MKKQNGSITLQREYSKNTSAFLLFGFYDTWQAQQKAIASIIKLLIAGGQNNVQVHTYKRPDGYNSTYITIPCE